MPGNIDIKKGILISDKSGTYLLGDSGEKYFKGRLIWPGYLKHWKGKKVSARELPQHDYERDEPVIIMRPCDDLRDENLVELYYNERLVKYPVSFLGHIAINVGGEIFNFSHLINENEIITHEEYFYRPALGEFAPHPELGVYNIEDVSRPYYDKFGRLFMRSVHSLKIMGMDTARLHDIFMKQLDIIHSTPEDKKNPGHYRDFNILTRSCSTIIRDGFREYGLDSVSGVFPRDLFVNTAYNIMRGRFRDDLSLEYKKMDQLTVPEAGESRLTFLLNPVNRFRNLKLKSLYNK